MHSTSCFPSCTGPSQALPKAFLSHYNYLQRTTLKRQRVSVHHAIFAPPSLSSPRQLRFFNGDLHSQGCKKKLFRRRTYRWSAGNTAQDSRKRESLLDNVEPQNGKESQRHTDQPVDATDSKPDLGSGVSSVDHGWGSAATEDDWGWGQHADSPTTPTDPSIAAASTADGFVGAPKGVAEASVDTSVDEDLEVFPDVTILAQEEQDAILPATPTAEQAKYFVGDFNTKLQQYSVAAVVALLASVKWVLLSAGAFAAPFAWPYWQAYQRNLGIKTRYKYIGLWRAKVLDMEVIRTKRPMFNEQAATPSTVFQRDPSLTVLVGDDSGARTELSVPYSPRFDNIAIGEAAELLVLANSSAFDRFKALKEVYLPESGLWLSNYPYMNRDIFLDISLDIERERQAEAAALSGRG